LLFATLLVALAGSAFGAGTFASFTATTTNDGSTFSSGYLQLGDSLNGSTYCLSTVTGSPSQSQVDANSNACGAAFTLTAKKPGDSAFAPVTLQNSGTVAGTLSLAKSGTCSNATSGSVNGSGNLCDATQMYIGLASSHANATSGTMNGCFWGKGASAVATGSVAVATGTYTSKKFKITIDGGTPTDVNIADGTYNTPAAVVAAINSAFTTQSLPAYAGVDPAGIISITSKTTGTSSDIVLANPSSGTTALGTGALQLGIAAVDATNGNTAAACTGYDGVHTLENFGSGALPAPATVALATNATQSFAIGVSFASSAGNTYQGRSASLGLTWTLVS
jgi:hypothetical protein